MFTYMEELIPIKQVSRNKCFEMIQKNECKYCPNFLKCTLRKDNKGNVVINEFKDFKELIVYKENFVVNCNVNHDVNRARNWFYDEDHVLKPINEDSSVFKLMDSIQDSRKRSVDNIYAYALCNDWNYFVTLTFKHGKDKKLDDELVKSQWKVFRQKLQRINPDVKIILVPEYTPTGVKGLHFHGFIGNIDLSSHLQFARNNDKKSKHYGELLYTKYGDQIYNFSEELYIYGFSTLVKIRPDSSKLKLINYLNKYISKDNCKLNYNAKAYFRTYNLDYKEKIVSLLTESEINSILAQDLFSQVEMHKETDRFKVYRIYKN